MLTLKMCIQVCTKINESYNDTYEVYNKRVILTYYRR